MVDFHNSAYVANLLINLNKEWGELYDRIGQVPINITSPHSLNKLQVTI